MTRRQLEQRGHGPNQPSLFGHPPLHEEGANEKEAYERKMRGMYKAIVSAKRSLVKYVYEDPNAWKRIAEVWDWVERQERDWHGYHKNAWWLVFSMLEKENEKSYEGLKRSWRLLGDFRKKILFACGAKEHSEFLYWVIKQRISVLNDSMPWMFEYAIKGILLILTKNDDLLAGYKEYVEKKLCGHKYEYREHFITDARIAAYRKLLYDILSILNNRGGLTDAELRKVQKKIAKNKEVKINVGKVAVKIANMINPEFFINTASQHTQND